ncbi:putative ABC transport system substrate-binding protein [Oceanotoga teriensis]|uniref:ABC transport system substrate-binding protein n=1 Tax=Oceanotoga teriensis TaxID=515440 RepID=A0AA45HJ63_9BACT|nr:ABC transporter substrate-binding protein [Oceanotoga teriensis]PWJ95504.1 putative ABC transport system substrate-binding protein [Oceanotoga teriensis]
MRRFLVLSFVLFNFIFVFSLKIGISQIVDHPVLNSVYEGVIDALNAEGIQADIDYQNAQGIFQNALAIAKKFKNDADFVVAISTPSAQAAKNEIDDKPIVFSAVSDPVGAGLIENWGKNTSNVVGISDMLPIETHFKLMKVIMPTKKNIAILYNPGEANSKFILDRSKNIGNKIGLNIIEVAGSNVNELITSVNSNIDMIDVVYLITDNLVASSSKILGKIFYDNKIPVVASDQGSSENAAFIGFGFDYYSMGRATGEILIRLINGESTFDMESKVIDSKYLNLYVNLKRAENAGINVPESFILKADKLVK